MNAYIKTLNNIFYEIDIIGISTTLFRLLNNDIYIIDDYREYKESLKLIIDEIYIDGYSIELEKLLYFENF
ncbi:MAG: hypothetical protein COX07_03945 [Bacteroidetes bacterium CG23_combo_of_CG06-09_8_20_14_all_32_9]|nr:MAG: hypothetical protein COX07_03945 [Bacteroidetes bacterium CG23_combo_of_CG06-09_8_20_14_all_32_9]